MEWTQQREKELTGMSRVPKSGQNKNQEAKLPFRGKKVRTSQNSKSTSFEMVQQKNSTS